MHMGERELRGDRAMGAWSTETNTDLHRKTEVETRRHQADRDKDTGGDRERQIES